MILFGYPACRVCQTPISPLGTARQKIVLEGRVQVCRPPRCPFEPSPDPALYRVHNLNLHARDGGCTPPTAWRPAITPKSTTAQTGHPTAPPTPTACFSPAPPTTAWSPTATTKPPSPTPAASRGPTAPHHPKSTTPTTPKNSSAAPPTHSTTRRSERAQGVSS
jgi:hypothetical protein